MKSLNCVMLIGNLGKDPEAKFLNDGTQVTNFSIACGESWKDKEGNKQERTEWVNIVAWKKLAEICSEYLHKGSKVFVEGKLQTRSWDDKNSGVKRYMTEVVINDLVMLDGKQGDTHTEPQAEPSSPVQPDKEDLPF